MPKLDDYGTQLAEESLEKLEREYRRIYSQAAKEMREKQRKFLKEFEREKSQRLAALDNTEEAEKAYKAWLRGQTIGKQWLDDMVDELSKKATEANESAVATLLDQVPGVYAGNANYEAYAIEKSLKARTAFTLVSEDVVRNLVTERGSRATVAGRLLPEVTFPKIDRPKDYRWNRQKFTSAITQGILQGESIPNIVKRTESIFGSNSAAAYRAARTAVGSAQNSGRYFSMLRAEDMGIIISKKWKATHDDRTRDSHVELDGTEVPVEEPFESAHGPILYPKDPAAHPAEVWNCFIGSTEVYPLGGIERGYKRLYTGEAVTIHTAGGVQFTCTPNHPIMTSKGWVAAGLLHKGDNLVIASRQRDLRSGVNPDVEHVGTRFDALFELLEMLPGERAGGLSVDFHGDVSTADVDVIAQERPLRVNIEPLSPQPVGELGLVHADAFAAGNSAEMEFSCAAFATTDSLMGGGSEPASFFRGSIGHALVHGLRAVPRGDSIVFESDLDDVPADAKLVCDALDGGSFLISLDDVIDIDISTVSCHVYNLQTESGIYLAGESYNGSFALAHNCRCTIEQKATGFKPLAESYENWLEIQGMSYEEWEAAVAGGKTVSRFDFDSYTPGRPLESMSAIHDSLPQRMKDSVIQDYEFGRVTEAEYAVRAMQRYTSSQWEKYRYDGYLDSAIMGSSEHFEGPMFRGMRLWKKQVDSIEVGGVMRPKGVQSWSREHGNALDYCDMKSDGQAVMLVDVTKGKHTAVSIEAVSQYEMEREVLSSASIEYEIVAKYEKEFDHFSLRTGNDKLRTTVIEVRERGR